MASESMERGLLPILLGIRSSLSGPGSRPDRILLVNPASRRMFVIRSEAAHVSEMLSAMGGGSSRGAPPASKKSIEAMRTVKVEEEEECPVCLDEFKKNEEEEEVEVKEMPCKHRFHCGCIEKWLRMNGSCPVCRFRMPEEEEEDGEAKKQAAETGVVVIAIERRGSHEEDDA